METSDEVSIDPETAQFIRGCAYGLFFSTVFWAGLAVGFLT